MVQRATTEKSIIFDGCYCIRNIKSTVQSAANKSIFTDSGYRFGDNSIHASFVKFIGSCFNYGIAIIPTVVIGVAATNGNGS